MLLAQAQGWPRFQIHSASFTSSSLQWLEIGTPSILPKWQGAGEPMAVPPNVWDTRPSSELSSRFSLRLTHYPPPPPKGLCGRSLPSWERCTAQRHAQVCSLNHPLNLGSQRAWLLFLLPSTAPRLGEIQFPGLRVKAIPSGPSSPGVSRSGRGMGKCGRVNLEGHQWDKPQLSFLGGARGGA